MKNKEIKSLFYTYDIIFPEIEKKLNYFVKKSQKLNKKEILKELCFCILTPQSKAEICWDCIKRLNTEKLLLFGTKDQIRKHLKGVRFYRTKAESIIKARTLLKDVIDILKKEKDPKIIRKYLVKNIRGLGMKEATHFLRNIGRSNDLAILDRHILRRLHKLGIIEKVPQSLSVKKYIEIEKKMQKFAKKIKIPVSHLDLLFWYQETGRIFK